jgi:hypothetical protein
MGFYESRNNAVPIKAMRVAADIPPVERTPWR